MDTFSLSVVLYQRSYPKLVLILDKNKHPKFNKTSFSATNKLDFLYQSGKRSNTKMWIKGKFVHQENRKYTKIKVK